MDIAIIDNDIIIRNGAPEMDGGLETAVWLSLFLDARDSSSEEPRGWWADALEDYPFGSRLWTLYREKQTDDLPDKAKAICEEALAWMKADGVAKEISVDVSRAGVYSLFIAIQIERPDGESVPFSYEYNWQEQSVNPAHARY